MARKKNSGITQMIVFFLVIAMLWLFTVTPFGSARENALWNIVVIASLGVFFFSDRLKGFIEVKNTRSLVEFFSVGVILGVFVSIIVSFVVQQTSFLWNLLGSIPTSQIANIGLEQAFWSVLIQPLSETILFVPVLLFLVDFLKPRFKGFSKPIALFGASFLFASLHFLALGAGQFEQSLSGFIEFVGSPNGAFPQMLLGVGWGILILGFQNWVVGFSAHYVNNLLAFYNANPTGDVGTLVFILLVSTVLIVLITFYFTRLRVLNRFSFEKVIS